MGDTYRLQSYGVAYVAFVIETLINKSNNYTVWRENPC